MGTHPFSDARLKNSVSMIKPASSIMIFLISGLCSEIPLRISTTWCHSAVSALFLVDELYNVALPLNGKGLPKTLIINVSDGLRVFIDELFPVPGAPTIAINWDIYYKIKNYE